MPIFCQTKFLKIIVYNFIKNVICLATSFHSSLILKFITVPIGVYRLTTKLVFNEVWICTFYLWKRSLGLAITGFHVQFTHPIVSTFDLYLKDTFLRLRTSNAALIPSLLRNKLDCIEFWKKKTQQLKEFGIFVGRSKLILIHS